MSLHAHGPRNSEEPCTCFGVNRVKQGKFVSPARLLKDQPGPCSKFEKALAKPQCRAQSRVPCLERRMLACLLQDCEGGLPPKELGPGQHALFNNAISSKPPSTPKLIEKVGHIKHLLSPAMKLLKHAAHS